MGLTAVNVAKRYEVSRADMDKYAQRSQELAVASQGDGFFDREIVPITDQDGNEVAKDDGPRASSTLEKLSQLEESFGGGGVTAGNSCPLNDGAAAVLLMSDTKAKELGLTPRARIVTAATYGNEPEYMGVAPIVAVKKVLDRAGMTIDDVDVVELNEALPPGDPIRRWNPAGKQHPRRRDRPRPTFGMTGARHGQPAPYGDRRPPGPSRRCASRGDRARRAIGGCS